MIRVITDKNHIAQAQGRLRRILTKGAGRGRNLELGYQGGRMEATLYWRADLGIWVAFKNAENRYWNAFGLGDPESTSSLSITVEINPPYSGIDRRIGGAYGVDSSDSVYLLHRGKVGGGRSGIGKRAFLHDYKGWGALKTVNDGGKETTAAVIAALDDQRASGQIASFVRTVERFKNEATGNGTSSAIASRTFSPEFSGNKVVPPRDEIVAQCDHGIIVNELAAILEQRGFRIGKDQQRDLFIVGKRSQIQVLFEVKPKADPTSLYGAIGQLVLHAAVDRPPKRVAVLPKDVSTSLVRQLELRGITTLKFKWQGQTPIFIGLERVLP